jgi:peptidoglycan/xylan/chitin deacetylase (PgdA/CDA1 family)
MENRKTETSAWVRIRGMSIAEKTGFGVLAAAGILFPIRPVFSAALLALFILLCVSAPFFPRFGFYLPVISRGDSSIPTVSLTFDDGPDPEATPALIDLLSKYGVSATFFVIGRKAEKYPDLIEKLLLHGHSVCNHSYSHNPVMMLRRMTALRTDIESAQAVLKRLGIESHAFRPPAGITNPLLGPVLDSLGLFTVNFSCRGVDFGNRRMNGLSGKIVGKARPGDIIMMHDIRPPDEGGVHGWLDHVESVILGLRDKGLDIVPLNDLIGRPVMTAGKHPV